MGITRQNQFVHLAYPVVEGPGAREPELPCYFFAGYVFFEQSFQFVGTALVDVFIYGASGVFFKQAQKMEFAVSGGPGKLICGYAVL